MVLDPDSLPRVREDLVLRQLDDDWVVYDPEGNLMHVLNLSAVAVYERCDGQTSVESMVEGLLKMFETTPDPSVIQKEIGLVLEGFADAGLLS
jgi:hypothetical protein